MTTRPRLLAVAVGIAVLVLTGVQVARVHAATGEFRLTPSQAPEKLREVGRDYMRSSSTPAHRLPKDSQEIGETPGGGELFGPRHVTTPGNGAGVIVTPVLWVRDDDGNVWTYELLGSP